MTKTSASRRCRIGARMIGCVEVRRGMTKTSISALSLLMLVGGGRAATLQTASSLCAALPSYGSDANAGGFVRVNGIRLYYEVHGGGSPLLLIHGNGDSIASMRCQIAHFSRNRRVIIADSRSHGKSEPGTGRLTYEQIADDLSALLGELKVGSTDVLGHSDGGIVALLLAIRHPRQVGKLVASSANLRPDTSALFPWFLARVRQRAGNAAAMLKAGDRTQDWANRKRQLDLMLEEPHIPVSDLRKIAAPTLIIGADADIMPLAHTVEIYSNIPQVQLFIMPGATHGMPVAEYELYNLIAGRFLDRPFTRPTAQPQAPR